MRGRSVLAALLLGVLPVSVARADFNWYSELAPMSGQPGFDFGYVPIADISSRNVSLSSAGLNYGQSDGFPARPYADYFSGSSQVTWTNVSVPALAPGQFYSVASRAGHSDLVPLKIEFLTPGTSTVVATDTTFRKRHAGWQGSRWDYDPFRNLSLTPGTYDVRVSNVNASTGSHLSGFGVYEPLVSLPSPISGMSVRLQAEGYSWGNGTKQLGGDFSTNTFPTVDGADGFWMDNFLSSDGDYTRDWVDFEVYQSQIGSSFVLNFAARTRGGGAGPTRFELLRVLPNGDLADNGAPLATLTVQPTGGWQGTPWTYTLSSDSFLLPAGEVTLRLRKQSGEAFHMDFIELVRTYVVDFGPKGDFGGAASKDGSFNSPDGIFDEFDTEGFFLALNNLPAYLALNPGLPVEVLPIFGDFGGALSNDGSFNTADGTVDEFDAEGFFLALNNPTYYAMIQPGARPGPAGVIPEPTTLGLLGVAALAMSRRRH